MSEPQDVADPVVIRRARVDDLARISDLLFTRSPDHGFSPITDEQTWRWSTAMLILGEQPGRWRNTLVAETDGQVAAVLVARAGTQRRRRIVQLRTLAAAPLLAMTIFGPAGWLPVAIRAFRMQRLWAPAPKDAYYVAEVAVDARFRNRGIGRALLTHAEADARARGFTRTALHTVTTNPARRLYEREGYQIAETRTDPREERRTGTAGVHLMVKDLR